MKCFKCSIGSSLILLLITSSMAFSEESQDKPIARVFDHLIYDSDISPKKEMLDRYHAQLGKDKFDQWKKENKIKALEFLIYSELQKDFLKKTNMKPTDEEFRSFIDFSIKSDKNRLEEFKSQRQELLTQLESPSLSDAKRKSLNDHLKILDQLIVSEHQRNEEAKMIPNYAEIKKRSMQQISISIVTTWKFNKALYDHYGGRVIFQQAGYEPIDAYKIFLDEHSKAKTFEIFDPSFNPIFDRMYKYFEMGHNYMDTETANKYFAKPWWDPTFEPL